MSLPRYAVARQPAEPVAEGYLLTRLLDRFRIDRAGPMEVVVGVDVAGQLRAVDAREEAAMEAGVREAVRAHELAAPTTRTLRVAELWLLRLEGLEFLPDAPGVNDPVQVLGELFGPWFGEGPPVATRVAMTVTRGDLIAGLLDELPRALVADQEACLHLVLPGEREEAIVEGRGVVLAWPGHARELGGVEADNGRLCGQLLYDVLQTFQEDLRRNGIAGAFARATLPVPSRAELEERLRADGYTIEGDWATRVPDAAKRGITGLLTRVLGVPDVARTRLPAEGGLAELVPLAEVALMELPAWPHHRAITLRERTVMENVLKPPVSWRQEPPRRVQVDVPRPPPPPPPRQRPSGRPDWMADFAPGAVTRPAPTQGEERKPRVRPVRSPNVRPAWMDDFD